MRDWNRLWANTAVLMGGGLTALGILELLPQESTAWNSHENGKTPLFKRWLRHVKEVVRYGTVTNLFSTLCSTPMPAPPTT